MNASDKKVPKKTDRRTKAQLLEELEKAHSTINGHEKKLTDFQKKLAKAEADIAAWEQKSTELKLIKMQLENNQKKIEKYRRDLKSEAKEKESAVMGLQKDIEAPEESKKAIPGGISTAKATFRIDIYPRQGHFQGKIVHPLTKDYRILKGLDMNAILDFISEHLPRAEEQASYPQISATQLEEPIPAAEPQSESSGILKLRDINVFPAGASIASNVIKSGQTFQVNLTFDPTEALVEGGGSTAYKINVYAKRLESGSRQIAGAVSGNIKSADIFTATVASAPLSSGTYKIETDACLNPSNGRGEVTAVFKESDLIHVY